MASLDPTSTTSAADVFKQPLPAVKQFQRQLQFALDDKNGRLRTLVGGSYRQLLGTAEMIVEMRQDIDDAEAKLSTVAERCGRVNVERKAMALGGLEKIGPNTAARKGGKRTDVELGLLAKVKALDGCVIATGRLLRGKETFKGQDSGPGSNLVTAAMVLVLSRLLLKNVTDEMKGSTERSIKEFVEETRRKWGNLRKRLLRNVEKTLANVDVESDREDLIKALSAYALATSSGTKDVVRWFLHMRGEAMVLALEDEEDSDRKDGPLRALKLLTSTILDVQAILPRRLSEALQSLKIKPLLKNDAVRDLEGLRLDMCEKFFGDEINYFIPYIRHDDLDGPQAKETLASWTKKASEVFLEGWKKTVARLSDFKAVVDLRTSIFETWISESSKAKGFDSTPMLDNLRQVINERLTRLVEGRVSKLHLVGTEIEATLSLPDTKNPHSTLWDSDLHQMDLSGGAAPFKDTILSRMYGRDDSISRVLNGYQTWHHLIDEITSLITQLRSQKWEEDSDEFDDDVDLDSRNDVLSKDDPQMLQDHLHSSLAQAFSELDAKITTLWETHRSSNGGGATAIYLLRVIRDIRSNLPNQSELLKFGLSVIPSLHESLIGSVLAVSLEHLSMSMFKRRKVTGRALWEGDPELPVQPSPMTFKFLRSLVSEMTTAGMDLWTAAAVRKMKEMLSREVGGRWIETLRGMDEKDSAATNGNGDTKEHAENNDGEEPAVTEKEDEAAAEAAKKEMAKASRDVKIQALFDVLMLQLCLALPGNAESSEDDNTLKEAGEQLSAKLELDTSSMRRLRKGAQGYWKRTSLLFGLLA